MARPVQDPFLGAQAVREAARRRKEVADSKAQMSLDGRHLVTGKPITFKQQRAFIEDGSMYQLACCSRRGGKSDGVAIKMFIVAAANPGKRIPYVTLTRPMAKNIIWGKLRYWAKGFGLKCHWNNQTLECTLPNGACLFCGSAETFDEVEKLRGGDYPAVFLDEVQAFKPGILRYLIEEVLTYALLDHFGTLVMTGTPNAACAGFFHDAATGKAPGWSVHHWTMFDNPHIRAKEWAATFLAKRKLTGKEPKVRREMWGEWVRDSEHSVFYVEETHLIAELPLAYDWEYVIGCDFGYKDSSAFVVLAYSIQRNVVVAVEAFERTGLLTGQVAEIVHGLYDRYKPTDLVGDMGGLGKPYAEEIIQRHNLPMEAAEKTHKLSAIELLNDVLRTERMLMLDSLRETLWIQARELEWDFDKVLKKRGVDAEDRHIVRADLAISTKTPDHLTDAWLYAFRACRAYLHVDPETPPDATPDDLTPAETRMWEEAQKAVQGEDGPEPLELEAPVVDEAREPWDLRRWTRRRL